MSDENEESAEQSVEQSAEQSAERRAGRCAIVGPPNVGKSTLMNALLEQKLAIVTDKPGTTRSTLLGVHLSADPPTQIAFLDTPGLEQPKSVLGRAMIEEARGALEGADALIFVIDASRQPGLLDRGEVGSAEERRILAQLKETGRPIVLALNKVDRVKPKERLLPVLAAWSELHPFAALVPTSALRGVNLAGLLKEVRATLPEGWLYEDEVLTDRPERFFAAELVREAVMAQTHQEIPYSTAVTIESYELDSSSGGGLVRIEAVVQVERESQKGIVIGKGGQRLKEIGTAARQELEAFLGSKVFLSLHVKVKERWAEDAAEVRRMLRGES